MTILFYFGKSSANILAPTPLKKSSIRERVSSTSTETTRRTTVYDEVVISSVYEVCLEHPEFEEFEEFDIVGLTKVKVGYSCR